MHFSPYSDLGVFDGASHMAVMQAYFDASEQGDYLVVAGYLFRKKNVKPFERKWRAMLLEFGLEYFHMTDCNAGKKQFEKLDKDQRIECQTLAIATICEFATLGMTNSVNVADFKKVMGANGYMTNPFSLCAHGILMMCKNWAENFDKTARIAYIFEAGDNFQSDAHNILSSISEDDTRRRFFNYETHAFLTKRSSMPTQAADILAWNAAKQYDRQKKGIGRIRTDFAVLLDGVETMEFSHTIPQMQEIVRIVHRNAPYENAMEIAGLGMKMNRGNHKAIVGKLQNLITPEALSHILRDH
jgi:hypothetical protein